MLDADGFVTMKVALPDSGSNAGTALAHLVAEMLGFTTRDRVRLVWGDTDLAPSSDEWFGGRTSTLQGAAICSAADKLRQDLLGRAANLLKVDAAKLQIRDGVISSTEDPKKSTTFAALVKANKGVISQTGRGVSGGERGGSNKGVGACFAEVEVDTWTGNWRFIRAVYPHDTGLLVSPLVAEADMVGSLIESTQLATDPIPWDREFPGTRHYSVGYLSYRLPTIMDVPRADAGLHRQPGATLVLRHEEFQRNQHRRRCPAPWRTRSTMRAASGSGSIRSRAKRLWRDSRGRA